MNSIDHARRRVLQGGLAAGSLFLPLPYAWVWAQTEGTIRLLKAPKTALVIGNGKYKDAPELKNAPNDAKAIAETLKASGFAVTMLLDTGREALIQAIRDYVNGMEKQKAVGLFYFAGHGVQLEWRNYLLPIDAVIDKIEDVARQSVDIARLMEGLTKAANPMNVIILDACRENPFGTAKPVAQKGLSQMDAPTHTILAYATSPGNVASDGDGANGLYTENLLRELKVPEAKIEDVFKRVRLGVRRKSNGAQIPWESTSLEEDFWFLPPKELKKLSDTEKEKQYKEEAALWERAEKASEPGPIEEYLRRYPTGNFAELAQVQLDGVLAKQGEKKVEIVSARDNPYTKGSAMADTRYKVGDSYSYRVLDLYSKAETNRYQAAITQITDTDVIYSNGFVTDLLGNTRKLPDGRRFSANQNHPAEFSIGKRWQSRFITHAPKGEVLTELQFHIVARESITVPAGTFNAFRVEASGGAAVPGLGNMSIENKLWFAPDVVRGALVRENLRKWTRGIVEASRTEMVSFKQS
jgi:Caspase domain